MADEADLAQQVMDRAMQAAIMGGRQEGPEATGYCLNCDAPIITARRWCCPECRDEWQRDFERRGNGG